MFAFGLDVASVMSRSGGVVVVIIIVCGCAGFWGFHLVHSLRSCVLRVQNVERIFERCLQGYLSSVLKCTVRAFVCRIERPKRHRGDVFADSMGSADVLTF